MNRDRASITRNPGDDEQLVDGTAVQAYRHSHVHEQSGITDERGDGHPSLTVILQGAHVHHARNRAVVVEAGSAVLYRADEPYRLSHPFLQAVPDISLYLDFDREVLDELFGSVPLARDLGHLLSPSVQVSVRRLLAVFRADGWVDEELALLLLGDVSRDLALGRDDAAIGPAALRRVNTVREALASEPEVQRDLVELGKLAGSSPYHLARLFRRVTGVTIGTFRLRIRLARALQGLADGADDLTTLAHATGFVDHAHMTNSFRRVFGSTPSALREEFRTSGLIAKRRAIQAEVRARR